MILLKTDGKYRWQKPFFIVVNREHRGTHTSVESESPVKLSRRMIDLRSGPAHVGKHDDRTATLTTEDLAGALTSDGLPQRREQLREPAQFLHGESVAVKNTPATTSPTVAGNGTSMEQHSILSLLQRQAGADRDDRLCNWAPCLPPIQIGEMHASDPSWQQRRNSCDPTTFGVGRAAPANRPAPASNISIKSSTSYTEADDHGRATTACTC
jgi:hypothetical protein